MKKDFIIALGLGFGIGLIIAVSVIYAPQILSFRPSLSFLNKNNKTASEKLITISPTSSQTKGLEIQSPKSDSIITEDSVEIKGTADPKSIVVISTKEEEKIATASNNGNFSIKIDLQEGQNLIYITSYLNGEQKDKMELELFKTSEDL